MAKTTLKSHISSLLTKIAAEKSAEELGTTSFPEKDNGTTNSIPSGTQAATYDKLESTVDSVAGSPNVGSTPDGAADSSDPAGFEGGIKKLTPDEKQDDTIKSEKDIEDTTGPKATDEGAGKVASLSSVGNEILSIVKGLAKPKAAPAKVAAEADPVAHIKTAAEQHPDAFEAGYKFASMVAEALLAEEAAARQTNTKVASEADNAAIKVAEFLMGLEKTAMDPLAAAAGMGGADLAAAPEGAVAPEELAAAAGEMAPEGDAGMGGLEGATEDDVVEALAAALEAEGITPEELAAALEAEAGMGDGAGMEAPEAPEAPEVEEAPEAEEPEEVKEAMERRVKIASAFSDRIKGLKKAGLVKKAK